MSHRRKPVLHWHYWWGIQANWNCRLSNTNEVVWLCVQILGGEESGPGTPHRDTWWTRDWGHWYPHWNPGGCCDQKMEVSHSENSQSVNASRCKALWTCRSAIFKMFLYILGIWNLVKWDILQNDDWRFYFWYFKYNFIPIPLYVYSSKLWLLVC